MWATKNKIESDCLLKSILAVVIIVCLGIIPIQMAPAQENEECFDCHNPDILEMSEEERTEMVEESPTPESEIRVNDYLKNKKPFADLSLSLDQERYGNSVHADLECITCHNDIEEIPHRQHLQIPATCCDCHDEEIAEAVKESVHGKISEDGCTVGCMGCHDPHYGQTKDAWDSEFEIKGCLPCHEAFTNDTSAKHGKWLPQAKLHLTKLECNLSKVGCIICHVPSGEKIGEKKDPHKIMPAKLAIKDCRKCHSSKSILLSKKTQSKNTLIEKITDTKFTQKDIMPEGQYLVGANRIPLLDTIGILVFLGTFGLPIVHGGLRFLTRKKKGK